MSASGNAVFLISAFVALISAIGTITVRTAIRSAMCLLVHILALSGLFLTLHAHLLAALQILVYAGAVVVLFVFVIMLIGPAVADAPTTRGLVTRTAAAAVIGILTLAIAAVLAPSSPVREKLATCAPGSGAECNQFGGVAAFSLELFQRAVVPFELVGILLTVAVIGAIAVARGRNTPTAKPAKTELVASGGE